MFAIRTKEDTTEHIYYLLFLFCVNAPYQMAMPVIIIIDNDDTQTTRTITYIYIVYPSDAPRRRIRTDNGFIILLKHTKLQCAFTHADTQRRTGERESERQRGREGRTNHKNELYEKIMYVNIIVNFIESTKSCVFVQSKMNAKRMVNGGDHPPGTQSTPILFIYLFWLHLPIRRMSTMRAC